MRKMILGLMLLTGISLQAQIASWVLHPTYDKIKPLNNGNYVVSKNGRQGMVNAQEQEILRRSITATGSWAIPTTRAR